MSPRRLRVLTYSTSSAKRSGQSMALRPLTWASPVMPGADLEAFVLVADETVPVVHRQRARADEGDLAAQEVPQRRQFVEARGPQPLPDTRHTLGVELRSLTTRSRMAHRPELEQRERPAREAEPALPVDHTTTRRRPLSAAAAPRSTGRARRDADSGDDDVDQSSDPIGNSRRRGHDRRPSTSRRRAGTPTTVAPVGTSAMTTAPAPIVASAPIRQPGQHPRAERRRRRVRRSCTPPPIAAPGATWTNSPTWQSWSTDALVLTIVPAPISVAAFTTEPARSCTPSPNEADVDTIANRLTARVTIWPLSVSILTDGLTDRVVADSDAHSVYGMTYSDILEFGLRPQHRHTEAGRSPDPSALRAPTTSVSPMSSSASRHTRAWPPAPKRRTRRFEGVRTAPFVRAVLPRAGRRSRGLLQSVKIPSTFFHSDHAAVASLRM